MKYLGDGYLLESTGRTFYAHCGLLSPGADGELMEGYDGTVWAGEDEPWTPEERAEIADFMIAEWQAFKVGGSNA